MTNLHFEDLWEKCEHHQKELNKDSSAQSIVDELMMKLTLYKTIDQKAELSEEDIQKVKSHTLGEILLTLTELSYKDNINVYAALNAALNVRQR